jgi:hypothetical protein
MVGRIYANLEWKDHSSVKSLDDGRNLDGWDKEAIFSDYHHR